MAGATAGGMTSFLMTLRFAVVFLAFLEGLFPFFFAICLLDDAAAYIPSNRLMWCVFGRRLGLAPFIMNQAYNDPDYVDLVEFLKTFKHDPRVD
jgi:hypothetical protein